MELNPKYNIVLTAKHENPAEHSLEELVKEWEEKESVDQPQVGTLMCFWHCHATEL